MSFPCKWVDGDPGPLPIGSIYINPKGVTVVVLPNMARWYVDERWTQTGDPRNPPTFSVTPSIRSWTDSAEVASYHGYLTNGVLTDNLDGPNPQPSQDQPQQKGTRMIYMADSTTASDIPESFEVVGGYVDGQYKWSDEDWARFPSATLIRIATSASTNDGNELDVETGDATAEQAPDWAKARLAAGLKAVSIYVSRSGEGAVRAAMEAAQLGYGEHWVLRSADWTGVPHDLSNGAWAVQYADPSLIPGHPHYDLSSVNSLDWLAAPPEPPKPPSIPYPLPDTDWYGVPSADPHNHSGYYWAGDQAGIREIQHTLGCEEDGLFGLQTQANVIGFQRSTDGGLRVDGLVGPLTWHALFPPVA